MRVRLLAALSILFVVGLIGCSQPAPKPAAPAATATPTSTARPTIVFMTDFGVANDAVAICRAVIWGIAPDVRLTDITHQVTPFSIEEASRFLFGVTPYYPANTVFLIVVDPGVGTSRKAIIAKSKKGQYFVAPDNGVLTPVLDRDGFAVEHRPAADARLHRKAPPLPEGLDRVFVGVEALAIVAEDEGGSVRAAQLARDAPDDAHHSVEVAGQR